MDSSQRVGIGGTPTSSLLELHGASSEDAIKVVDSTNSYATTIGQGDAYTNIFGDSSNTGMLLGFGTPSTGNAKVTILAGGDTGIGLAAPKYKLDTNGVFRTLAQGSITFPSGTGAGKGVEFFYNEIGSADNGQITSFDRGAGAYKALNIDASSLSINSGSSGNVAIGGTPSSGERLDVISSSTNTTLSSVDGTGVSLRNSSATDDNYSLIRFDSANGSIASGIFGVTTNQSSSYGELAFTTRGSGGYDERMRIDSSGNVGIGTTEPANKLTAYGTDASTQIAVDGTGRYRGFEIYEAGTRKAYLSHDLTDSITRLSTSEGLLSFSTGETEHMFIDSSGNVGIGTDAPSERLHIADGNLRIGGDSRKITFSGNQAEIGTSGNAPVIVTTNGSEAMRIDSSGRVIVTNMPTSDPAIAGALWSDSGTVKISAG